MKLQYGKLLSNVALKFKLRRYILVKRLDDSIAHATQLVREAQMRLVELPLDPGRAMQIAPIKPKLKALGTKPLKLKYDGPL